MDSHIPLPILHSKLKCVPIALAKMTEPDLIRPFNLTSSLGNMVGRG